MMILLLAMSIAAGAAVPPMISYQGKLMQPSGAPVPDGSYSIQFAIYDDPASADPEHKLWSETNANVQVKGGLFSVLLGSVTNLPANIFDNPDRWFGVKVGSDPEMTPRQKIASVAYAVKAGSADLAATVPDSAITTGKIAPGAVTADRLAPGVAIPTGTIVMWSGAVADIPQGWKLCDGTNGTPDLGSKFIVGVGGVDGYAVGDKGGFDKVQLTVAEIPSHQHFSYQHTLGFSYPGEMAAMRDDMGIGGFNGGRTGGDQPHENRPPYYALCFIMKHG